MLKMNSAMWAGAIAAAMLVTACSGDKVLPEGKRIAVLDQSTVIRPDVANGAAQIKVPAAVEVTDWRQVDANNRHAMPNAKFGGEFTKAWKESFGSGSSKRDILLAQPLINGDNVYALDVEGRLTAFNLTDGEKIWKTTLEPQNKRADETSLKGAGIATDGATIYATTGFGDVFAVNAADGEIKWRQELQTPLRIAPTLAAGKVMVQNIENKIYALDAQNGEILWNYDIALEDTTMVGGASVAYSPSLDVVITGFSNGEIQAFSATFGTPLWSDMLISNRQAYSSTYLHTIKAAPVIEGDTVYALGTADVLAAVDIRSGMRIWEKEIGGSNTPLLAGNALYIITENNDLVAVDTQNGKVLWAKAIDLGEKPKGVRAFGPVMIDSRLLVALSNGMVYVYSPAGGAVLSEFNTDEDLNAAPIVANGYILFVTKNARLLAYK